MTTLCQLPVFTMSDGAITWTHQENRTMSHCRQQSLNTALWRMRLKKSCGYTIYSKSWNTVCLGQLSYMETTVGTRYSEESPIS